MKKTRRISCNSCSSPATSSRRYADDEDGCRPHYHLFELEQDSGNIVSLSSPVGDVSSTMTPLSTHRTLNNESENGDGWSVGVLKFKTNHSGLSEDNNDLIFNPSDFNVAHVPAASYVRDTLLKREFNSIKQSLVNSYEKYRNKKKASSDDENQAMAYQHVEKWLQRNKKKSFGTACRLSKSDMEILYQHFNKKFQVHYNETGVKVLDYETLVVELLRIKMFKGKIEANNFLQMFELDEKGTVSLSDFSSCVDASSSDIQICHLKAFIKKTKREEEQKRKLEEARQQAREMQRQQQMALLAQQEANVNNKRQLYRTSSSRRFSSFNRLDSTC